MHQRRLFIPGRKQFQGEIWQPGFHDHRIRDHQDFGNQIAYIAANPERRHLENHPYVHTQFLDQVDPMPDSLKSRDISG